MPIVEIAATPLEGTAFQYVEDLLLGVMLDRPLPAKTAELAMALPEELGATPRLLRKVLANSEKFLMRERRWDLALRELTERTVDGSLEQALRWRGMPMSLRSLCNEMALLHQQSVEGFEEALPKLLRSRDKYFQTPGGDWGLSEWLLAAEPGEDEESVFLRNFFFETETAQALVEKCLASGASARESARNAAVKIVEAIGEPVPHKILSFALWRLHQGELDSKALYDELLEEDRLLAMSPGRWALASDTEKYRRALARAAKRIEEEEPEELPDMGGEIAVMPADLDEIFGLMEENLRPYNVAELAELIFEVSPGAKGYRKAAKALNDALAAEERFEKIGQNSWSLPQLMPDEIWELPPSLMVMRLDPSRLEDPEADAELSDDGLEGNLAELVHDSFYEDFGEEADAAIKVKDMPDTEITIPVLYDHLQAGTLKVRKMDRKFWPSGAPAVFANVFDDQDERLGLWVNLHDGLIFGIADWYRKRGVKPGHLLHFEKTERADEYRLTYRGDADKYVALDEARIESLRALAKEAEEESLSVFDVICRLLAEHRKGLHFYALWAEVNLVRRTPRRVVASDLSAYHCFYPRPPQSGNWVYDERKVSQGRKKTKKKHIKKAKAQ
ncbi:hypothetical protein AMK68_00920 [candidate division KD3-62 bacterium DG_56]|uniref:Uncharacterized protein n=1 Tax=candidate division KD3-62 bacterium DG_56 TaxID=1704032 RepID=A0A0S7XQB6_9BACT|nr:MAG: hypothetical protein AMK68_00920 [candidate division KD3-62 bacterium DG_56]